MKKDVVLKITNYGWTKYRLFRAIKKSAFLKTNDKKETGKKNNSCFTEWTNFPKDFEKTIVFTERAFFKQTFERYDRLLT